MDKELYLKNYLKKLLPFLNDNKISNIRLIGNNKGDNCHLFLDYNTGKRIIQKNFDIKKKELKQMITSIATENELPFNSENPILETEALGSRFTGMIFPVVPQDQYITLTIRPFRQEKLTIEDLIKFKSIEKKEANLIKQIVEEKSTILLSGGSGVGKTTMLNIMLSYIPMNDIVVTIEDTRELFLNRKNYYSLLAQEEFNITMKKLLKSTLRIAPDWIIMGEIRDQAEELLRAISSGHFCIATIHSQNALSALYTFEQLLMQQNNSLTDTASRSKVAYNINYVIQLGINKNTRKKELKEIIKINGIKYNDSKVSDYNIDYKFSRD